MDHSPEDESRVVEFLHKLEPGKLPFNVFHAVAGITVTPIIEVVPLRRHNGTIEVLLFTREASDPVWGGLLHTPGTVVRASDRQGSFADAFDRILKGEMAGVSVIGQPTFVETRFHQVKRGRELAMVYWVTVAEAGHGRGSWYQVEALPATIVDTQREFIATAAAHFQQHLQ
ncbi:MAG: hypothetical protein HY975_01670 [Candidatus Kerfeldbacteria bacterium]|nr:hypothetical protein [Candidatus Kerfeldbacteria bacterium]